MTATAVVSHQGAIGWSSPDRAPLLRWLIFTGATVFGGVLLWRYGLLARMIEADRTYISSVIGVLYIGASLHCLWRTLAIAAKAGGAKGGSEIEAAGANAIASMTALSRARDRCRQALSATISAILR